MPPDDPPRSSPRASARDQRRARRRAELYRVALELFAERGFSAVTVEDVTRAADVSKGTFFNYFESKEALLVAYRSELFDVVHAYGESLTGDSARELFRRYFRKLARHVRSEGRRYAMLFQEVVARPHVTALEERRGEYLAYFLRYLEVGRDAGEIAPDRDPRLLAETLRDLWAGTSLHWFLERPTSSLEGLVLRRVDLLFDLLEAEAAAG